VIGLFMYTKRQLYIFWQIFKNQPIGISGIMPLLDEKISTPTLNRELAILKNSDLIEAKGKGPSLKYYINRSTLTIVSIPIDDYFKIETDQRQIFKNFSLEIFETLKSIKIFSEEENEYLEKLTLKFRENIKQHTATSYKKEFERLMIELSWKSSQIEGNTYDLLDTEQLLKYNVLSKKNSQEEATMLLNHKTAIEYSSEYAKDFKKLSIKNITELHTMLTKKLGVAKNLRKRIVRIIGTNYVPPENPFLIEEYLDKTTTLINSKKSVYEKALLTILLVSYIQPYEDGNKRTARITANALLMGYNCSPLSYRSIPTSDYKKAILLFYEINNISAFKKIFIDQYAFAVNTYF
jgi:Fic family protein